MEHSHITSNVGTLGGTIPTLGGKRLFQNIILKVRVIQKFFKVRVGVNIILKVRVRVNSILKVRVRFIQKSPSLIVGGLCFQWKIDAKKFAKKYPQD